MPKTKRTSTGEKETSKSVSLFKRKMLFRKSEGRNGPSFCTGTRKRTTVTDPGQVDIRIRAEVIRAAHSRCQICGGTVQRHGVTLVVDHKKPRDWGTGFPRRRVSLHSSLIAVSGETTSSTPAIWFSAHTSFSLDSLASFTARVITRLRWSLALRPGQGSFSCFGFAPTRFKCASLFVVLIVLSAPAAPLLSVLV